MLSDEEKKAIEYWQYIRDTQIYDGYKGQAYAVTLVNLIEKQSKEIEELKENKGYHLGFIDGRIAKKYEYQDKIKAKIEEVQNMKAKAKDIVFKSSLNYIETELKSLLKKE